jgi:hypothetical protein
LPAEKVNCCPDSYRDVELARMAELVDAADSKSAVRKDVQVRFLFRALFSFINHCKRAIYRIFLLRGDVRGDVLS